MSKEVKEKNLYRPEVKVSEANDKVVLVATLPGVNAQGVDLTIEKDQLKIQAEATFTAPEGYEKVYGEFAPARYERTFNLSGDIDQEKIEAKVDQGVITIELAKKKESLKKIEIKAS